VPVHHSAIINGTKWSEAAGSEISKFYGGPNVPPYEHRARTVLVSNHVTPQTTSTVGVFGGYGIVLTIKPLFWHSAGLIPYLVFDLSIIIPAPAIGIGLEGKLRKVGHNDMFAQQVFPLRVKRSLTYLCSGAQGTLKQLEIWEGRDYSNTVASNPSLV